jgi:putative ABC transport system permease protein
MLASTLSDLRFALRSLARRPVFYTILILILGVGLGGNAAMFSVVDSVLLEPLPYPEADRLVWMWSVTPEGSNNTVAALDYVDCRERNTTLEGLAAFSTWPERFVTTGGDEPEVLVGAVTSGNFQRTLGVRPIIGRGFMLEDEDPAAGNLVVLSHAVWQRRFGGDPDIVGRTMGLEGGAYEVIGVMPAGFAFPEWADIWRPLRMNERQTQGRGNNNFRVFGRLAPGATIEQARSELQAVAATIAEQFPDVKRGWTISLQPLQDVFVGEARTVLWLLQGAVGLVLLIACANVAALLLARAVGRHGEVAVRLALGASRGRVARQMLTESVVLALLSGALGLAVAYGALKALPAGGAGAPAQLAGVDLDSTALVFTLIASLATGLLFGLAPALRAPRLQLVEALKEGRRGMRSIGGANLQCGLVVGQVALSLVLLVGAGLLMRSFLRLRREELGFRPRGVITAQLRLPQVTYGERRDPQTFFDAALDRLRALPSVEAAGFIDALPMSNSFGPWNYVYAAGRPPASQADRLSGVRRVVSPGYFRTMGIPLIRGRDLQPSDVEDAPLVAVINRTMADDFFPGEDPVGQSVVFPWEPPVYFEVVGVVGDVPLGQLQNEARSTMFFAQAQAGGLSTYVVLRSRGSGQISATALAAAIHEVDPTVAVSRVRPMTELVGASMAADRFRTFLLGAFAAIAMLLAALGLYGVLVQLVGRRTHELGVRMALGADRANVLASVVGQGMRLTALGLLLGLAGAAATTRFARGMLFGVQPLDPATFAGSAAVLALAALAAAMLPAWRATRVDPVECLRAE